MRRREFIPGLGSAATWPLAARARQRGVPVVGYLGPGSPEAGAASLAAFRKGLSEAGYVEGRNVVLEDRWSQVDLGQFPQLANDLVRRGASAIVARTPPGARAAMAATSTIPIVFLMGEDPVKEGIVRSLNRPGGNVTGFTDFANQLAGKRLGLMHDAVPRATSFALLVNPANPNAEPDESEMQAAALGSGLKVTVLKAANERDLEGAFAAMAQAQVGALIVNTDGIFFDQRREQIAALATRYAIPAMYDRREFPAAGGLMSYGPDRLETQRQAGIYIGGDRAH